MKRQFQINKFLAKYFRITLLLSICFLFICCSNDGNTPNSPSVSIPTLSTTSVSQITSSTAKCGGVVTSDGGATIIRRGVCWSTSSTPTTSDSKTNEGEGAGSFTSNITNLLPETKYYVRAYATNSVGTGYGSTMTFKTEEAILGTVTDIDGNVYQTIKIGDQRWMAENLKVTHYQNGDPIPNVINDSIWWNLTTGAYCNYDNDTDNVNTNGRLYNFFAVNDYRNIAPEEWHLPTDEEWMELEVFMGMSWSDAYTNSMFTSDTRGENIGGKFKETGTSHWRSPNTGATNESGFTALGAGYRTALYQTYASYIQFRKSAIFWTSSTSYQADQAYCRLFQYDDSGIYRSNVGKIKGFSIRCVRD